ncbi:MAG: amidohydrolase family protein [Coprococcus sp.]
MIVDTHTHIYPDKIAAKTLELLSGRAGTKAHTDGSFEGLRKSMKEAGIDVSIVLPVATSPKQYERINSNAQQTNEHYQETGIWSLGGIHPLNDNYREILKDVKDKGLKGIKLHPDYQDTFFNDIRYKRIIDYASELDLVVVVHAGIDIGLSNKVHCTPDMVMEILDEVKPSKLVLAHMGGWQMWDEVYEKLCGRDIYFDTAFSYGDIAWKEGVCQKWRLLTTEMFFKLISKHNLDKILFATDSPWSDQKKSIEDIKRIPIADELRNKMLGGNAERLFGLEENDLSKKVKKN